jgi:hypothetical protein
MIGRVIILACFIFGASQALAAISHTRDRAIRSHHTSFDVKHPLRNDVPKDNATTLVPSIAAAPHYSDIPNILPALTVISILGFSVEDPLTFDDQSPPTRKTFKDLFGIVIAPNAP